ncbi:8273535e-754a-47a0-9b0a-d273a0f4e189 [Sclerotinia trifoliorum]|uniref:8273535e-754a-47a0-9b0a-d273a0f4e189 n=1 Tax=Sclerotinia trifoliorum TaxID=28548 RepID=A0A8H2ZS01_9HELO|nr:8273535e-754a-47a0-9b0a-d273a0f4e189 [Sclerotinia trifoliorum]
MSFGWSAGDIAQAISVIFKTVKALDDAEGAPADFRNTVTFFQSVNLTLQRLQSLINTGKRSSYDDQIRKEVEIIKPSLERFLAISRTFESSLGDKATPGRWKHIPKKLLWRFKDSKAVKNLKEEIKDHLPILDKWILFSMVEIIQDLPAELQKHFIDVLNDQIVSILQLQLNPVHDELRMVRTEGREHYKYLFSEVGQSILKLSSLQLDIASQGHATQRNFDKVMSKLENKNSYDDVVKAINEHTTSTVKDMLGNIQALPHASFQQASIIRAGNGIPILPSSPKVSSQLFDQEVGDTESLRKVYYMILLYAGLMARNILLRLANLMEPSRAPTPYFLQNTT